MSDRLSFNSKTDMWVLVLLMTSVAACIAGGAQYWSFVSTTHWWVGVLLVLGIVLPLWLLLTTRYYLSDTSLSIRCGPFSWDIPVADIASIAPTNDMRSGPALSLDRMRIEYGSGRNVLISPEPRAEFLRQLEYRRRKAS